MFQRFGFGVIFLAILFLTLAGSSVWADGPDIKWSPARQIPGYPSKTNPPLLVVDRNRTVHAFHAQPVDDQPAIVYSTWTMADGWTMPADVLLPPRAVNAFLLKGAFLDKKGNFHVIFLAGDATYGGDVYYSRAAAVEAGRTAAWSVPKLVADKSNMIAAALTGDNDGNLFIFYSGTEVGNGLYEVYSRDGGDTWSEPLPVFLTNDSITYPGEITLLVEQKELHLAWVVWRPPYGGEQLYYARLDIGNNQMTTPIVLARPTSPGRLTLPGAPSMVMYRDTLYLIYQEISDLASGSMTKLMRRSVDHGKSWSKPVWAFAGLTGGNGSTSLLVDGNNGLHAVFANRAGDCCHGMWYSQWMGDHWSDSQAIITPGAKTPLFDPQIPQAVISQGNVILATWINEEMYNGVLYSYAKVNAAELPIISLPVPTATLPPAVVATDVPTLATATPRPARTPVTGVASDVPPAIEPSANITILFGVVPAVVLLLLIVVWRARH